MRYDLIFKSHINIENFDNFFSFGSGAPEDETKKLPGIFFLLLSFSILLFHN